MSTPMEADRTGPVTQAEMDEFRRWLRLLTSQGWTLTALAKEIGYESPSLLSTVLRQHDRKVGRDKYDNLKVLLRRRRTPPKTLRAGRNVPMVSDVEFKRFQGLIEDLRDRDWTMEELAKKAGYKTSGGLYQALRRKKVPVLAYQKFMDALDEKEVERRSEEVGQMPPTLPRNGILPTLDNVTTYLDKAKKELDVLLGEGNVQWIVRPGLERARRQIEELRDNLKLV